MELMWIMLAFWAGVCVGFLLLAVVQMSRGCEEEVAVHAALPRGGEPGGLA